VLEQNHPQSPPTEASAQRMTKAEREELAGIVRLRTKVARANVEARKGELIADFEEQLAALYKADDERWAAATAAAERAVNEANARITTMFAENGIPEQYRPYLRLGWANRGENQTTARRGELRRVAASRLEAQARAAKVEIDRVEANLRSDLASCALETSEARAWLDRIPAPEQLLPRLDVEQEVQQLLGGGRESV
jgi:hypothetical protein